MRLSKIRAPRVKASLERAGSPRELTHIRVAPTREILVDALAHQFGH